MHARMVKKLFYFRCRKSRSRNFLFPAGGRESGVEISPAYSPEPGVGFGPLIPCNERKSHFFTGLFLARFFWSTTLIITGLRDSNEKPSGRFC
jgi:hypothetical protein